MNQRHTPRSNKWRICPRCNGEGRTSAYLGSFTAEEFAEAFDPEGQEDYVEGKYDRECEMCGGSGKVHQQHVRAFRDRRRALYEQWRESGCPEGSFDKWAGL